jgi:phospholipase C
MANDSIAVCLDLATDAKRPLAAHAGRSRTTKTRRGWVNPLFPLSLAALCLTAPAQAQIASFQHIIVVIQENRTPDNLFQGLCTTPTVCSTRPGPLQYNIQTTAWRDKTSPTGTTTPHVNPLGLGYDMSHAHSAFVAMCDPNNGVCAMDGAAKVVCYPKATKVCPDKPGFGYVDPSQVQPYLDLARAYGWANYMFQTNQGPSFAAHQYLFGATSAPSAQDDHNGFFAAENMNHTIHGVGAGCIAAPTTTTPLINPQGVEFTQIYPCFEHQTLADLLDARGVTWRYYGVAGDTWVDPQAVGIWMAPNAIAHTCGAVGQTCMGKQFTSNVEVSPKEILSDISPTPFNPANCNLRAVSWVIPGAQYSDHSWDVRFSHGPSWVASIVNALDPSTNKCKNPDGSSYWNSTAILITWDDWGGWYDHEPPPTRTYPYAGYEMGFRVPLIVVSAYTPAGFISNSQEDFGSVARFIERNFGIGEGALTFADARSFSDLREFFFLSSPPRRFQPINAPLSAKYFLHAKLPNLPPDDE